MDKKQAADDNLNDPKTWRMGHRKKGTLLMSVRIPVTDESKSFDAFYRRWIEKDPAKALPKPDFVPPTLSDESMEMDNYFNERRNYNARAFAPVLKSFLDRLADRAEKADRLGVKPEPVKRLTNEELQAVKAAFTDEDYQNFLAMRENPGQDPDGQDTLPTDAEYVKATGRKLFP